MKDLYERLREVRVTRKYLLECVLPDWWKDSLASVPSNRAIAEISISRALGLTIKELRDHTKPLKF